VHGRRSDGDPRVLTAAPTVCPECSGCGWRPYSVETLEGKVEWAWELCPRCEGGDAFPPEGDE
jgi:hypothetical protein